MGEILHETVFLQHHGHVLRAETEAKAKSSALQDAAKKAKELGIDMDARKIAMKIAKMDPIAGIAFVNSIVNYALHMRAPIADQLVLLDEFDKTKKKTDRDYYNEGFFASVQGGDRRECRHDVNSPQGRMWMQGYDAHQGILMNRIKPLDGAPAAAPAKAKAKAEAAPTNIVDIGSGQKRRGRPPKAAAAAEKPAVEEKPKDEGETAGEVAGADAGAQFEASEEELAAQAGRPQRDVSDEEVDEAPRGRRAGAVAAAGGRRSPPPPPPGQM